MGFRSRGIRISKGNANPEQVIMKCYYDDTGVRIHSRIEKFVKQGILEPFEYSIKMDGNLDSYNYHVQLSSSYLSIYENLSPDILRILRDIEAVFDDTFLNYTIGYRFNRNEIVGETYYFYPTVFKENERRYGIQGLTDHGIIELYLQRFYAYIQMCECEWEELNCINKIIYKFKGISVSVHDSGEVEYKIYFRSDTDVMYQHVNRYVHFNKESYLKYGDVVLAALRIKNQRINGYNIYYLE